MKVIHLISDNDHNNINVIKKHMKMKPCLIFIVAPWCGFCKRLQSTINTLEKELIEEPEFKGVSVITVHDDQLSHVGLKAKSYPTITMVNKGKKIPNYSNEYKREADDIRNYIRKHIKKTKTKSKSKSKKNNNKKGSKTFKLKKKYKINNYKGPGSKDPNWFNKVFNINN